MAAFEFDVQCGAADFCRAAPSAGGSILYAPAYSTTSRSAPEMPHGGATSPAKAHSKQQPHSPTTVLCFPRSPANGQWDGCAASTPTTPLHSPTPLTPVTPAYQRAGHAWEAGGQCRPALDSTVAPFAGGRLADAQVSVRAAGSPRWSAAADVEAGGAEVAASSPQPKLEALGSFKFSPTIAEREAAAAAAAVATAAAKAPGFCLSSNDGSGPGVGAAAGGEVGGAVWSFSFHAAEGSPKESERCASRHLASSEEGGGSDVAGGCSAGEASLKAAADDGADGQWSRGGQLSQAGLLADDVDLLSECALGRDRGWCPHGQDSGFPRSASCKLQSASHGAPPGLLSTQSSPPWPSAIGFSPTELECARLRIMKAAWEVVEAQQRVHFIEFVSRPVTPGGAAWHPCGPPPASVSSTPRPPPPASASTTPRQPPAASGRNTWPRAPCAPTMLDHLLAAESCPVGAADVAASDVASAPPASAAARAARWSVPGSFTRGLRKSLAALRKGLRAQRAPPPTADVAPRRLPSHRWRPDGASQAEG